MSKILKKTVRKRKQQILSLYRMDPPGKRSWRKVSKLYYPDVKPGTLGRFATRRDYVPKDEQLLNALGLIEPDNPYKKLPHYYKRSKEALEYFETKGKTITELGKQSRDALNQHKKRRQ